MAFTQVTGTITDPNGFPYAGANLAARLVSTDTPRVGANLIDAYTSVKLDANGSFAMQLADNATVTPVASTWTFQVDTDNSQVPPPLGTGPQSFIVAGITITGAAQSVSAALSAAAPNLTRTISGSGSISGGTIGPSVGHVSANVALQPAVVLEIISSLATTAPLGFWNTATGGSFVVFLAGAGGNSFIQMTPSLNGALSSFIAFGDVGGTAALQLGGSNSMKLSFFLANPVARQLPTGGTGGSAALQSLLAALGKTTGSGLIDETSAALIAGQNIAVDGAMNPIAGNVVISKGSQAIITLAAPTTPAQDYTVLRITSLTAFNHQITGPAAGFNNGGAATDVATFTTAAIGDGLTLMAFGGVWYIQSMRGTVTLS